MRKILVILAFFSATTFGQHLPLQSQYLFNGVALNPAATGSEDVFSVIGSMRAQWVGFLGAPRTQSLTAHAPLKNKNSAMGVQVYADQVGVDRVTGIFGSYAYRLRFEKSKLALGVAGGVNLLKSYYSRLDVNDSDDGLIMNDSPLGVMPDFSIGAHYYTDKYFISFSVPMFLSHEYDGTKFRITNNFSNYNWMLGGGYLFELKNGGELKPSLLVKYRGDARPQVDINLMYLIHEKVDIGLSYRTEEAIIALCELRATKQFSLMYSFGMPLSSVIRYQYGSHELSLKYNFMYKTKMTSPRFLGY